VKEVAIATSARFSNGISDMRAVGDLLFFVGAELASGPELWKSDGTGPGTALVQDIRPGSESSNPQSLAAVDGRLFFTADDGTSGGQLWTSDGTTLGTARLTSIQPGIVRSLPQYPAQYLARTPDVLLFAADDTMHGRELWGYPLRDQGR
jgi:ELWxxDGT repeat protein